MNKAKLNILLLKQVATIKEAMQRLNKSAEGILFIIDKENKLQGTITDGDIRRGLINGVNLTDKIECIINKEFIALEKEMIDLELHVKKIMKEKKLTQIPILDSEGKIVDVFLWTNFLSVGEVKKYYNMKQNKVVIMAGGKGARLDPFTKVLPKPLIPVNGKPIIELIMERFYRYGFSMFVYTLNHKKEYLKLFLVENNFPYSIEWIEEDDFLGTAGSLSLLKENINDTFFVTNCDSLLDIDLEEAFLWHKEHNASITIIGCHNEIKIPFGVIEMAGGRLSNIIEKPTHDVFINTGVYIMEPHIISYIPRNNHLDMNQLINIVKLKERVTVFPIYNGWFDVGQWEEYKKSAKHFSGT